MTDKNTYRVLLDEAEKLLTDATNTATHDRIELRDAVCAYMLAEQTKGNSIDAIRISVEAILIRAEVRIGKLDGHKELAKDLVDWCLDQNGTGNGIGKDGTGNHDGHVAS